MLELSVLLLACVRLTFGKSAKDTVAEPLFAGFACNLEKKEMVNVGIKHYSCTVILLSQMIVLRFSGGKKKSNAYDHLEPIELQQTCVS